MKYTGMPFGMWTMFAGSFQRQLTVVLGYDTDTAKAITKKAKSEYSRIIAGLPEFEKGDRFKMNLVNCAMIGAFLLSMPERPDMEGLTEYYALDYTMSEAGGVTDFVRQYTLSSGGPYCDCGYKKGNAGDSCRSRRGQRHRKLHRGCAVKQKMPRHILV